MSVSVPNPVAAAASIPPFDDLPHELAVQIYENVFSRSASQSFFINSRMPAVTMLNHAQTAAAREAFFKTRIFIDSIERLDFGKLITWLEDIISDTDARNIRSIKLRILSLGHLRGSLERLWLLVRCRCKRLSELCTVEVYPDHTNHAGRPWYHAWQTKFDEAMALGRRGREQKWETPELRRRFDEWKRVAVKDLLG